MESDCDHSLPRPCLGRGMRRFCLRPQSPGGVDGTQPQERGVRSTSLCDLAARVHPDRPVGAGRRRSDSGSEAGASSRAFGLGMRASLPNGRVWSGRVGGIPAAHVLSPRLQGCRLEVAPPLWGSERLMVAMVRGTSWEGVCLAVRFERDFNRTHTSDCRDVGWRAHTTSACRDVGWRRFFGKAV